jgi:hypothetical protein
MKSLDASGGLFTLALRDESPQLASEVGSVLQVLVAVAASFVTGSGKVRRRRLATFRGRLVMRGRQRSCRRA